MKRDDYLFCEIKLKIGEVLANTLKLKVLKEELPSEEAYSRLILEAFEKKAARRAVDWKSNVADYIVECRNEGGIPIFKTRYADQPFITPDNKRVVLGLCWGGFKDGIEGMWFVNVPEDDIKRMEREYGDWKWLIKAYGSKDQVEKAFKAPVVL